MLDKNYLIAGGCSFTEGHMLGNGGAWPKFLGDKLNLQIINLGKGGSGNDSITWRIIEFCETHKDITKNSIIVIQLTECLRYHVYFDNFIDYPNEWHITPLCFQRDMEFYKSGNDASKWIYKNRKELIHIYSNITFALYKTLQNIISLVSYFESNNYPYIIFDGINDHKPIEYNGSYYLKESDSDNINKEFKITTNLDFLNSNDILRHLIRRHDGYFIDTKLIESIFSNKKIMKNIPPMLKYFRDKGILEKNDDEYYFKNNGGHPNLEACDIWGDILKKYIQEIYL